MAEWITASESGELRCIEIETQVQPGLWAALGYEHDGPHRGTVACWYRLCSEDVD